MQPREIEFPELFHISSQEARPLAANCASLYLAWGLGFSPSLAPSHSVPSFLRKCCTTNNYSTGIVIEVSEGKVN